MRTLKKIPAIAETAMYILLNCICHLLELLANKTPKFISHNWKFFGVSLYGGCGKTLFDDRHLYHNQRHADDSTSSHRATLKENVDPHSQSSELSRLKGTVYADYAGAPPYSESVIRSSFEDLLGGVYCNPHSEHGWAGRRNASVEATDRLRELTLSLLRANPEEYVCILTSGATAGLKLVSEIFPWSSKSAFVHLSDNHNSVLGIRENAIQKGATVGVVSPTTLAALSSSDADRCSRTARNENRDCSSMCRHHGDLDFEKCYHLFAFPLESNFGGVRYHEALATSIQAGSLIESCNHPTDCTGISWYSQCTSDIPLSPSSCVLPLEDSSDIRGGGGGSGGHRWMVVLDAAKACGTRPPDLSLHQPDFVALSYYKIFGYPTGLGALLVRRDALAILNSPHAQQRQHYFGGGTVLASVAEDHYHVRRPGPEGFENGTLPFLSIPAALRGFEWLESIGGLSAVEERSFKVAHHLASALTRLRHPCNGAPVAVLHGGWNKLVNGNDSRRSNGDLTTIIEECNVTSVRERPTPPVPLTLDSECMPAVHSFAGQGPVVSFSVLHPGGSWVGHKVVERLACLEGVFLRTGGMCNPGALREALGIDVETMKQWYEAGHVCWDGEDVLDGCPTGVVRASFGFGSTVEDANAIVDVIRRHFTTFQDDASTMCEPSPPRTSSAASAARAPAQPPAAPAALGGVRVVRIQEVYVYPIKSCAGFRVARSWPLTDDKGLLFDRHWALVDADGMVLTQRRCPAMARLSPVLDLDAGVLRVNAAGSDVAFSSADHQRGITISLSEKVPPLGLDIRVCARNVSGASDDGDNDHVSEWFQKQLGRYCRFVEHCSNSSSSSSSTTTSLTASGINPLASAPKSFANEAQLLIVTQASLDDLQKRSGLVNCCSREEFTARFRPNIVVSALCIDDPYGKALILPYEEERWSKVSSTEGVEIEVAGTCPRCQVICVNPVDGSRAGPEPLLTLASRNMSEHKGTRMRFGVLANVVKQGASVPRKERSLAVGMHVTCTFT